MTEESTLTEEEQKAKEYVDFYYYWLFQYGKRKRHQILMDVFLSMLVQLKPLHKDTRPVPSPEYIKNFTELGIAVEDPYCFCIIEPYYIDELPSLELFCSSTGEWCSNTECALRARAISLSAQYERLKENLALGGLFDELVSYEYPEDSDDLLLYRVLDEGNLHSPNGYGIVQRHSKKSGLDIITVQDLSLSHTGSLSGEVVASIDLSSPLPLLIHEIRRIKESQFKKIPTRQELRTTLEYKSVDYLLERELIYSIERVSFSPKDEKARALGTWLYDVLDVAERYGSLKEAYEALKNGSWFNFYGTWDGRAKCPITDDNFRYPFPLDALGYATSEISVLRRLYRNTKRCIDACEVLSLKD